MDASKSIIDNGHRNYSSLLCYKKAVVIYDLTYHFCARFIDKKDRTYDQMVQAARSGKQNIAEGVSAATTSRESEIKLLNVAKASLKELLVDYEDFLRVRGLELWPIDDERAIKCRKICAMHNDSAYYRNAVSQRNAETIANIAITLLHQADMLLYKLMERAKSDFLEKGGIREEMTRARLKHRK
jgi:four helix bundle suffix protein